MCVLAAGWREMSVDLINQLYLYRSFKKTQGKPKCFTLRHKINKYKKKYKKFLGNNGTFKVSYRQGSKSAFF